MIVYANERGGRFGGGQGVQVEEGATVRERQTLVRIPDLSQMQVKVNVHESKVEELASGMPASILVQGEKYRGNVESIANQPEPTSWFQGNVKEYATIVKIDGDAAGLKPGMTSEVTILVGHLKDVLYLPLACIVESQGRYFVWLNKGGKAERVEVQVGLSNESFVEIKETKEGLGEGDKVIENPTKFEKGFVSLKITCRSMIRRVILEKLRRHRFPIRASQALLAVEEVEVAAAPAGRRPDRMDRWTGDRGTGDRNRADLVVSLGARAELAQVGSLIPAAIFDRLDADSDGKLVGDELRGPMKDRVDEMDSDGDGGISKEEFKDAMKKFAQ